MSIKAGQLLFDGNGFIIDRAQTIGVTNMNIPTDRVKEVGNFNTVGIVRDIPDLTFEIESLDVSTEIEAILCGVDPTTVSAHQALDFNSSVPVNVASPFRSAQAHYDAVRGVVIPYLTLESVTYRYGLRANATETFSLRGDSMYYVPGTPYLETAAGGSSSYNFANTALQYTESGTAIFALAVCWYDTTTKLYKRLFHGADYTDTNAGITLQSGVTIPGTATVYIMYGSATPATYSQSVNADETVKPAAIRSRNIDVYVGFGGGATPTMVRVSAVQAVEATRRVNLQNDEEFGNSHYTASDYDTADVNGTLQLRPTDVYDFVTKVQQLTDTPSGEIAGPLTSPPLPMEIRLSHPDTGAVLKTIYVPDATFTVPPVQGRVQQKLDITLRWESEQGLLYAIKGTR